jgi:hypothetical protein
MSTNSIFAIPLSSSMSPVQGSFAISIADIDFFNVAQNLVAIEIKVTNASNTRCRCNRLLQGLWGAKLWRSESHPQVFKPAPTDSGLPLSHRDLLRKAPTDTLRMPVC